MSRHRTDATNRMRLAPQPAETIDRTRPLTFSWNGKRFSGYRGDTIVSALAAAGEVVYSRSFKYHSPRGLLTASFHDPGCMLQVGDEPNVRGAHRLLAEGMQVRSQDTWPSLRYDVKSVNRLASRFMPSGFYYKTFMQPAFLWPAYEAVLRRFVHAGEKPDMLLLDEPTNHLDAESVAWLEHFLVDYSGTVVAITHDRYFLDNAAGWILELDRGEGIPWEGNYTSWLEQKDERLAQEASSENARKKTIEKELEWVRQNPKGRQAKSKARMARFEELNKSDHQKRNETNELFIPPGERLGDKVLEVNNLTKSFGDRVLIDNLSFSMPKGAIVGIVGANGAGKSTLFKMLSGTEQPDSGTVELGETVKLASVDQFRDSMNDSNTVFQEISEGADIIKINNFEIPARAYCSRFNFRGVDQQKRIGELSGGERNRVHLAKLLKAGGNVLLLDEPTNDLDVETLRALEEALLEFPGCAMVISHDRWFLDRIATHILDYRDEGQVNFYEGNYTEYSEWLKQTLGAAAAEPHRIKYKRVTK